MTDEAFGRAPGRVRVVVTPDLVGLRLDQLVAAATTTSRRRARALAAAGGVRLNGAVSRILSRPVGPWDVVEVDPGPDDDIAPSRPVPGPVETLWEDDWLLFTAKPSGVLSQPSETSRGRETAWDERVAAWLAFRDGSPPTLRLVHRLDRPTSGVVLFARRREAMPAIARAWRSGKAHRTYLAVVHGHPENDRFEVDRPIARDPRGGWRFDVRADGRPARTLARVLVRHADGTATMLCELTTGRTHQVRVHLAAAGHPVVGDHTYGGEGRSRLLLHALALKLPHPRSGIPVGAVAPIPDDIARRCGPDHPVLADLLAEAAPK